MNFIKLNIFILTFLLIKVDAYAQIPVQDLKLWLRGDSNVLQVNNVVTAWNDISVNAFAAVQPDVNSRPVVVYDEDIESNTIEFDGIDNILLVDFGLPTPQPNTYFIVWKTNSSTAVQIPFASFPNLNALLYNGGQLQLNGGSGQSYYGEPAPSNYIISSCEFNGSTSKLYRNGVLKNTRNSGTNDLDAIFEIGGLLAQAAAFPAVPGWLDGSIAEIIMYDGALNNLDRSQVETYLANKYTVPASLGPDTVVCSQDIKIGLPSNPQYEDILWSTGTPNVDSITITQNGTYWVSFKSFGLTITDTIEISGIVPAPQISLANDQVLCFGDSIQVDYTPIIGFNPSWINGQTTNSIIVKDSSQFVQVTHTDADNCSASSSIYFVTVDSLKLLSSIGEDRNICDGGNVFVETSSDQGPFDYLWNTGDTTSFTTPPVTGSQEISLEMTDFNNCVFRDTVSITAINLPAPNVDFSFDTVCPYTPSSFLDLSTPGGTDNIVTWKWKFTSVDSSSLQNPQNTFDPGAYNVFLTVETDSGCNNTFNKIVRTHKQPIANIEQVIICAQGSGIAANNSTVTIPDIISDYNWTIEGNNYSGSSPNVLIQNEGLVDFFLEVTTDKGCIDTTSLAIDILPPLLPDFEVQNICIGDSTEFTDITSSFSIVDRIWNFGALGLNSSEEAPKFLYSTSGSYTVELSLVNAIGCSNTVSKTIEIQELPTAFAITDSSCSNEEALFVDASFVPNGFVSEMTWEIESESYSGDSINYSLDSVATYSYFHSIIDNFGCYDDTTLSITVNAAPIVDFTFNPSYGTAPLIVDFTNSSNNTTSYLWDFDDNGATSILENPSHTFNANGSYTINLTTFNNFGCSASLSQILSVSPTELDLELTTLSFQKSTLADGSIAYNPSILLKNVGSRFIQNVDLYASVDMENKIAETWIGNLGIGQSVLYTFNSYFVISDEEALEYFCLEGKNVNDNTEENLENNKVCLIQNGLIQTSELYPNPTVSKAFLDIVVKSNSTIAIEVYDVLGKKVIENKGISVTKGYNQYILNCEKLLAGIYYLNITRQDEVYTHKLIISNP